ncbi:MAG: hypothetical protein MMC23_006934 [Stictis urceolatum]|nr:hypothetical protein [Stictis urceolata]
MHFSAIAALAFAATAQAAPSAVANAVHHSVDIQSQRNLESVSTMLHASVELRARGRAEDYIMSIVNKYDRAYGIPLRQWNRTLYANAYATVELNGGATEHHKIFPGTRAQVLIPGRQDSNPSTGPYSPFQLMYLAWLCEVPDDFQLEGRCPEVLEYAHMNDSGQTGHHDVLINPQYGEIGCAFFQNPDQHDDDDPFQGIWGCDLV